MSKIKVSELAKKLEVGSKEIISALSALGITVKSAAASVESEIAEKIEKQLKKKPASAPSKATAKKTAAKTEQTEKIEKKKPAEKKKTEGKKKEVEPDEKKTSRIKLSKPEKKAVEIKSAPAVTVPSQIVAHTVQKTGKKKTEMPKKTSPAEKKSETARIEEQPEIIKKIIEEGAAPLPEEVIELKVPDRFMKEIETEKVEKLKGKPQMQRAFQAIRKIETKKWVEPKTFKRQLRSKPYSKEELKPQLLQQVIQRKKTLKLREGTTVKDFAELISVKSSDVIRKLMDIGFMATINQPIDVDAALLVAEGFGVKLEIARADDELIQEVQEEDVTKLKPRPPVVTIMGHVDHGKTSLLDVIRETKVTETEAGGITQHIGAYKITIKNKDIVFLDTPGHEAFTALRARGAKVTDIVILVVAADDGVMPQTVEAINHAKAANVPIIVAINKIDKPEANLQKVKTELAEQGILSEDWGGQNIFAEVSAKQRLGIEHLLEMILLQAEVIELKANPDKLAKGTIIEAKLDKGRGPVATVLIQAGTLHVGDAFLAGKSVGKVRALIDDTGKRINEAGPSTPIEVIGFPSVPTAGEVFNAVEDEKWARQIALTRLHKERQAELAKGRKLTLDELYAKIKEGEIKELNLILKADVQGSVEAIREAFENIIHPQVKVRVIHSTVGGINESDIILAAASNAIIIGFNVRPELKASQLAEREGVDIRLYNIIYEAIEDVRKALEGLLEPTLKEKILGRAEVRQTYQVSRLGTIAGCHVIDGTINRVSDGIRIIRDNIVVYTGKISSLKRFKEDVKSVQTGYECGIMIENYNDLKAGDILENFIIEKIAAKL
ncbi:MAG: translation initiation factor IF-2 [Nitrospiraceae bacterium]|nr:translation initiation factor IF-2 [Nitrospiraceae bacterium]